MNPFFCFQGCGNNSLSTTINVDDDRNEVFPKKNHV